MKSNHEQSAVLDVPEFISRSVIHGERLSGHGDETIGRPEIIVFDGEQGSMLFSIESFHWADVKVTKRPDPENGPDTVTELCFQGKTSVVIVDGFVQYVEPNNNRHQLGKPDDERSTS
jgi:hypothetical protein